MSFLVRKIATPYWRDDFDWLQVDEIPADRVTGKKTDLRTDNNTLSFWTAETNEQLEDVALALASDFSRLEGFGIAWVESDAITGEGIRIQGKRGNTKVEDLADRHVDAVELDLRRLAIIAGRLAVAVRESGTFYDFTASEVATLLANAVVQKRVRVENLKKDLQPDVRNRVEEITK